MGYGSGGLAPHSHNTDKEVIGETNPLSSSSSLSKHKVEDPRGDAGGRSVRSQLPFLLELDDLLLAEGAFTYGIPYAVRSKHGNHVAVKRFKEGILVDERKFGSEVNYLKRWPKSRCLLRLLGYYYDPKPKGEKLLVLHSLPNARSLANFLRGPGNNSWGTRMKIASEIAMGVEYLHIDMKTIHGNLTSANILLDYMNNVMITDYELSRIMTKEAFSDVTAAASALGYRENPNSQRKSDTRSTDVYSFGVILLEMLTGKTPSEMMSTTTGSDLQHWSKSFPDGEGKWPLDPELLSDDRVDDGKVSKAFKLAMKCVNYPRRVGPTYWELWSPLYDLQ